MQKRIDEEIKMENKRRMFMINDREAQIRLRKIQEHEFRAKMMKQSEKNYD